MKIVRKQGFCSCNYHKRVVKDKSNSSVRYYYQDEPYSILIKCINCGQNIKNSFIPKSSSSQSS